jgi:antitoxin HigA-1
MMEAMMLFPAIDNLPPVHPGEILSDELAALDLSARKFAAHIGVPPNAITGILNGTRGISAEMALRLGRVFGTSEQYWMNLQSRYEAKKARVTTRVDAIIPLVAENLD